MPFEMPSSHPSRQLPSVLVTPDREGGGEDPFICTGRQEIGLSPLPNVRQALEPSAAMAMVSSSCLRESKPLPKKVRTKGCLLPSTQYMCVGPRELFCNSSFIVPEIEV
jgi:hypothetical protein